MTAISESRPCRKPALSALIVLLSALILFPRPPLAETGPENGLRPSNGPVVQRTLASRPGDTFVVLQNGLTVLLRRIPGQLPFSAKVYVRAGSMYEGEDLTAGLSHYLEHVVSGGTTRSFTEQEARRRLELMGGVTNAYTSFDRTVYYINSTSSHWRDALDLLLSYVSENTLDPQEVTREKPVIQQEIKMGENNPDSELWKLFIRAAYQVHPVRYPVIGYEEVFVTRERQDLLDYYLRRYQPENMILVVAGDVDPEAVIGFVAEKTKEFKRKADPPIVLPSEPLQVSPRWVEREMPVVRLTEAMIGFPSVALQSRDLYALDVLTLILGEGRTSRLNTRLKEKEKSVLEISATNWTPSYVHGQFMISLTTAPQHWPGVLKSIEDEMERIKKGPITREELTKARKLAIAQHVFGKETASEQASSLASSYFETGDPYFDDAYTAGIQKVTREQVQDVARRYLVKERLTVAVIHPPRAPEQEARPAGDGGAASLVSSASETGQPTTQQVQQAVEVHTLPNGLRVILKKDASLPLAILKLYGLGGLALEDTEHPGISAFTASLLTAGTKKRDKLQLARAVEDVGGRLESRSDNNTYRVSLKVLKEDFNLALDVLGDVVQNVQFPPHEIEKRRQETLLAIRQQDQNWQAEVSRLFKKDFFQNSSYRNDRLGTAESVTSFTRQDLLAFTRRMVNPRHSVLAVYGDIEPSRALAEIRRTLGGWVGEKTADVVKPDTAGENEVQPLAADRLVEKRNEKSAAALFVGMEGLALNDPRRPVLDMIDAVLSGAASGGRLFQALRGGTENLVYVVGGAPFYGKGVGFYGIISQTTLGNLEKVQGTILQNLKRLAEEPIPPDELERTKEMLLTAHSLELESLDSQAQSVAVNEVLGLGWDYDVKYPDLIRAVTAEQIQQMAKELFAHTITVRTLPENPVEILEAPPMTSDVMMR